MAEEGRRLGRGLAALIGDRADSGPELPAERPRGQRKVPIEFVRPNPRNPRKHFDEEQLSELSDSIRERQLRSDAPALLIATGLAMRRFDS